jgi:hypothetical protein
LWFAIVAMTKPVASSLIEGISVLLEHHGISAPSSDPAANAVTIAAAPPGECLWSEKRLSQFLNISERTLERWRGKGLGPPYVRIGRARRTRPSAALKWLRSREFATRAEELARAQSSPPESAAAEPATFPQRRGRPRKKKPPG